MTDSRTERPAGASDAPALSGPRAAAFALYKVLIALFVVGVLVQIFLAGLGIFDSPVAATDGASTELDPHRTLGTILTQPGATVLLVLALLARPNRRIVQGTVALVVLGLVQTLLADFGGQTPVLGALHTLLAFAYLGLVADLARTALDRRSR